MCTCTTIVYNTAWRSSDYQSSCYIFEGVEHYFTLINIHQLEETIEASSYHVAEHRPVRSESLQPHIERSSRPGPEPSSVEADVYEWSYALLVVHARKEE